MDIRLSDSALALVSMHMHGKRNFAALSDPKVSMRYLFISHTHNISNQNLVPDTFPRLALTV